MATSKKTLDTSPASRVPATDVTQTSFTNSPLKKDSKIKLLIMYFRIPNWVNRWNWT